MTRDTLGKAAFAAVILLAAALRSPTFFLGHAGGDQLYYTAAAMKLDREGFAGYTLRGVGIGAHPETRSIALLTTADPAQTIVAQQTAGGFSYYDEPVLHLPPLFPMLIAGAHRLLATSPYYILIDRVTFEGKPLPPPGRFVREEFYATVVPFAASVVLVWLVMAFAKPRFGLLPSLFAGFILAVTPLDVLAAGRVWADTLTAALVFGAIVFHERSLEKNSFREAAAAGIFAGLAILSKGSAILFPALALLWAAVTRRGFLRAVLLTLCAFAVAAPWFWTLWKTYGHPLYFPPFPENASGAAGEWFRYVKNRPWYLYPVNLVFQNPLFIFLAAGAILTRKLDAPPAARRLWGWAVLLLLFLIFRWPGREERYWLPAYPALAILAGWGVDFVRRGLETRRRHTGNLFVTVLFVAVLLWNHGLIHAYLQVWQSDGIAVPF